MVSRPFHRVDRRSPDVRVPETCGRRKYGVRRPAHNWVGGNLANRRPTLIASLAPGSTGGLGQVVASIRFAAPIDGHLPTDINSHSQPPVEPGATVSFGKGSS